MLNLMPIIYEAMTLEFFVQKLERMKPSEKLLIKEGFSGRHLIVFQKNYALEKKETSKVNVQGDSLIERLIGEYEAKYIRFSDYGFENSIQSIDGFTFFCSSSSTLLGYQTALSEIIQCDADDMSTVNYCAKNMESFLEALLNLLELQSLRLQGLADVNDPVINERYLNLCVSSAGGARYRSFFMGVIF